MYSVIVTAYILHSTIVRLNTAKQGITGHFTVRHRKAKVDKYPSLVTTRIAVK